MKSIPRAPLTVLSTPFMRRVVRAYRITEADERATALAFYLFLALVPSIVMFLLVGGVVLGIHETEQNTLSFISAQLSGDTVPFFISIFERLGRLESNLYASAVILVFILYAAIGFSHRFRYTLTVIFRIPLRPKHSVLRTVADYLLQFVVFLVLCVLIIALLSAHLSLVLYVREAVAVSGMLPVLGVRVLLVLISLVLSTAFFYFVYWLFARAYVSPRALFAGATVAATMFIVVNTLFNVILAQSVTLSFYGVAGSLVAFMLWLSYIVQALVLGALVATTYHDVGSSLGENSG